MKIRNRLPDIKELQSHILQDYLTLQFERNFIGRSWYDALLATVKSKSIGFGSLDGALAKIVQLGDKYTVEDMDTTLITSILNEKTGAFVCCRYPYMIESLHNIQADRNFDAHSSSNESDGELVRWAYSSLARLSSFLDDVFNRANSLGEARIDYVRHYKDQIALLHSEIEQEYSSSLVEKALGDEMEREIQIILHSSNPSEAYHQLWVNKYYLQEDKTLLERFMRLASEAGIESASVGLAELYFDRADYTKAGDYYSAALSILTPPQKLNLASLYVSNLCIGHTPEEGMEIISSCESKNKPIVSYRTADGHTFYRYGRKQ